MKIVVTGGSGFLGQALRTSLLDDGHAVANLTRRATPGAPDDVTWTPNGRSGPWARVLDGVDAVVNLAGESLAEGRWTHARKESMVSSRLLATRSVVAAIADVAQPPRALISASGVNFYGATKDEILTEASPAGTDFLAQLCAEWEREAEQASSLTRVVTVRTGMALHPTGGALAQMLLPFKLGVGGRLGPGTQYVSWIHRDDWVDLVRWLLAEPTARGAFNAVAPEPVTNAVFVRALGRALGRPTILPVPGVGLRLLYGEMADLLLTGQRAIPARAMEMGFTFRFARLEEALEDLFTSPSRP